LFPHNECAEKERLLQQQKKAGEQTVCNDDAIQVVQDCDQNWLFESNNSSCTCGAHGVNAKLEFTCNTLCAAESPDIPCTVEAPHLHSILGGTNVNEMAWDLNPSQHVCAGPKDLAPLVEPPKVTAVG